MFALNNKANSEQRTRALIGTVGVYLVHHVGSVRGGDDRHVTQLLHAVQLREKLSQHPIRDVTSSRRAERNKTTKYINVLIR